MLFRHKMIGCFCLLSFILCSFCGCRSNLRYPEWKDSHEAFGDGEYQLLHGQGEEMNLHNCAVNTSVLNYVQSYKTVGNKVYFFGKTPPDLRSEYDMFLILEPKTNAVQMILDDTTVPEEEIERVKRYVTKFLPEKPIAVLLLNQLNHEERNTLISVSRQNNIRNNTIVGIVDKIVIGIIAVAIVLLVVRYHNKSKQ